MKIFIEFPIYELRKYKGVDNLDVVLDDNISYLIGKYFYDNHIYFKILALDFILPKPNVNDELVKYTVEIGSANLNYKWIFNELERCGFKKGLTIKNANGKVIYADECTADIKERRKIRKEQKSK